MDARIARVARFATLCVLGSGVTVLSFAGSGTNVTSEDHTDPQSTLGRVRVSTSADVTMAPGWGPVIPVSQADGSGSRYAAVTLVQPDLQRIVPGASLTRPSAVPDGARILAVHLGAQTVYVSSRSEEEKQRYLADLARYLSERGLGVKPSVPAREAGSPSPKP